MSIFLVNLEENRAKVDVMMLRDQERTWYEGDSFTVEF